MQIQGVVGKVQPERAIEGISAVLLPFNEGGAIDFESFSANVRRTYDAGIAPAVNMDTGYTNLLTPAERTRVLNITSEIARGRQFVAGAFIEGQDGDTLALYQRTVAEIQEHGGTPILFQCSTLKGMKRDALVGLYRTVAAGCESLLGFELGEMFAPFGQIYDLDTMRALMEIPQLKGAKHSSLDRVMEWQRLELRDAVRPDFKIYTGNDLAIDMVCYGSDYLLGLSAFCPEAFALRDQLWQMGDARFYGLNDLIQYLGFSRFARPSPLTNTLAPSFLRYADASRRTRPIPTPPAALKAMRRFCAIFRSAWMR